MPQSKYSGVSGCSDAVSQGSGGSTRSTELVLGEEFLQVRSVIQSQAFCIEQIEFHFMPVHVLFLPGVKNIPEDAPACRVLLRKEVLRLVINLSSSVGTKGNETGLLT